MTYYFASEMVPGETYLGTSDGPAQLRGVYFTPLVMVTCNPEVLAVPKNDPDYVTLIQVLYDAWAYPLPESIFFAPEDLVMKN